VRGCARNADCTGGQVCHPALNRVTDRVDFICQDTPAMTSPAGVPCTSGETCQSSLCPPARVAGRPSVCTAPCVTDGDCPAAAPRCLDYPVARPGGAAQTARGCFAS
jgi:Cys-rich repeat protein